MRLKKPRLGLQILPLIQPTSNATLGLCLKNYMLDIAPNFEILDLGLLMGIKMDTHGPTYNSNAPSLVGVPF